MQSRQLDKPDHTLGFWDLLGTYREQAHRTCQARGGHATSTVTGAPASLAHAASSLAGTPGAGGNQTPTKPPGKIPIYNESIRIRQMLEILRALKLKYYVSKMTHFKPNS